MAKRRYTDDERTAALAALQANGGNVRGTARQLGIPPDTVRDWRDSGREVPAQKKESLAEAFDRLAAKFLRFADDDEKLKAAPVSQLMTGAGIAVDKARLLRGEPTSIEDKRHGFSTTLDAADIAAARRLLGVAGGDLPAHGGPQPVDPR